MSLWDATRYGFSPVYWLQLAGVPVVFAERETGLTLPSGYTSEDGSLTIDGSAEVGTEQIDRTNGSAVSLSLSFKLLDTATVRTWLRRWSKKMTLTADLEAADTAMTVDDSAGWSNGDAFYIGIERCTIGTVAPSGTSCTGLGRALVGTLAHEYKTGTTGQIITDRPRFWRGRDVILWASPCDASGYCTGTNLADDAVMVWRGRIDEGPARDVDGFRFQASSLDRIPARGLAGGVSGTLLDSDPRVAVSQGWQAQVTIRARNAGGTYVWDYTLWLEPFASDSDGDLLTTAEMRDRFVTAMAAAVSKASAGADVGGLVWSKATGQYTPQLAIVADATIEGFQIFVYFGSVEVTTAWQPTPGGWDGGNLKLYSAAGGNPIEPDIWAQPAPPGVTVTVDDGDPGNIPAPGKLRITVGEIDFVLSYMEVAAVNDRAYLTGLSVPPGTPPTKANELDGATCAFIFADEGAMPLLMLRALMSSGTGERSATYDTLSRGQGYGLSEDVIDAASFTTASEPVGSMVAEVTSGGATFVEMFGGALGLFRKAVVLRPDADGDQLLTLVDCAPYGAGYSTTITDTDLLSDAGDPVLSAGLAPSPNVLRVLRHFGGGSAVDSWPFVDAPRVEADGRDEVEYPIPATDRQALWEVAGPAAASHLAADQTAQAIEIRVGPWIAAEVGDIVRLELTHPALWTWSTSPGAPGYTGQARVVGRRIELQSTAVVLTLLADSGVAVTSLSPAAAVAGYDVAAAPTYIDLPLGPGQGYLMHMQAALSDAGGNVWLQHYVRGGTETTTQLHEISAAAESGGLCRLTVASTVGGHSLSLSTSAPSYLTLPTLDGAKVSAWQAMFAHVDDGTIWG